MLPTVDRMLSQMAGARVFSKLDANQGYHQLPLHKDSQPLTTFLTPIGRFMYCHLPLFLRQKTVRHINYESDGVGYGNDRYTMAYSIRSACYSSPKSVHPSRQQVSSFKRIYTLIKDNMSLQHTWRTARHNPLLRDQINGDYQQWADSLPIDPILESLMIFEGEASQLIDKVGVSDAKCHKERFKYEQMYDNTVVNLHTFSFTCIKMTVLWTRHVGVIGLDDASFLVPRPYLLMIHNKVSDLLSSLLLLQGSSGACYEPDGYLSALGLIRELCRIFSVYKPNGYLIVKNLEAICAGEKMYSEEEWLNTSLLESLSRSLTDVGFLYEGSQLCHIFRCASSPLKHELAGLMKCCGHPFIDIKATVEKMWHRGNDPISVN